ncbi:hypothetical protein WR25_26126 [Diploscapter pachys]|uniref:Arf-GAP domain-containing protein n=1 Tax=Diploscapter pachys TaxID=2018661 RepID=A0A2A2J5W8_9BILA|nr:hypothetical protein WR25_26126 [Diploscapter pachys]
MVFTSFVFPACTKILQQRLRVSFGNSTRTPTPTTPLYSDKQKDYQDTRYMPAASGTMYGPGQGGGASGLMMQPSHGSSQMGGYPKNVYGTPSGPRAVSSVIVDGPGSVSRKPHVQTRENNGRPADRSISAMFLPNRNNANNHHHPQYASGFDYRALSPSSSQKSVNVMTNGVHSRSSAALLDSSACEGVNLLAVGPNTLSSGHAPSDYGSAMTSASTSHLPTPSSTPNTQRKNRRISNIFQRPKDHENERNKAIEALNQGVGRVIPVKQGLLYKKSSKSALNREWKKKYVCLYSDGRLKYYQNLKEYMDKTVQGKEVFLGLATVKVSGRQRPRTTQRNNNSTNGNSSGSMNGSTGGGGSGSSSMAASMNADEQGGSGIGNSIHSGSVTTLGSMMSTSTLGTNNGTPMLKSYEARKSDAGVGCSGEGTSGGGSDDAKDTSSTTPVAPQTVAGSGKKRRGTHKRLGSSGKNGQDEDDECFEVQAIRLLPGNQHCADCGMENPNWASLNLGTLICIECSGIHRNLGSHISRVRSLELDDWPVEFLAVMRELGNETANKLWEHNAPKDKKPSPNSSRDAKEAWIRAKYEAKRYLPPLRVDETVSSQLVAAVIARDVAATSLLLARATPEDVNAPVSQKDQRTPLHLACSNGSLEILQLLFWNNADIRALDEQGRSCLWYAHNSGFQEGVEVLIAAGLPSDYGMPPAPPPAASTSNLMGHSIPENAILGSMASRDYSYISPGPQEMATFSATSARFRPNQGQTFQSQNVPNLAPTRKTQQQQNQQFETLPASVI